MRSHIRNDSRRRAGGRDALGAGAGIDVGGVGDLRGSPPAGSVDRGGAASADAGSTPLARPIVTGEEPRGYASPHDDRPPWVSPGRDRHPFRSALCHGKPVDQAGRGTECADARPAPHFTHANSHGGPHWDVQWPKGGPNSNVYLGGRVRGRPL